MALRIPWDIEEAVLMLDTLLESFDGKLTRKEAIHQVSEKLRRRAVNRGIKIDDIFRNENGITFQMSALEVAYTGIKTKLKQPTKLFVETVNLYRNQRELYEKILKETENVVKPKSVQDEFCSYLSTQIPTFQLSDAYLMLSDIESFCLERKILQNKLFETTDLGTINRVAQTVDSNRVFRFTYKRYLKKMSTVIHAYYNFLKIYKPDKEKQDISLKGNHAMPPLANINNMKQNAPMKEIIHLTEEEKNASENRVIDFNNIHSMAYTRPLFFSYFESHQETVDNWAKLYIRLMNCLTDDYPHILDVNNLSCFGRTGRIDYGIGDVVNSMTAPKQLENGCWIETNYSSTDIVKKIRFILELCNVNFENIEIHYSTAEATVPVVSNRETTLSPSSFTSNALPDGKRVNFYDNATYAFTKPLAFRYRDERHLDIRGWTELYVEALRCLNRNYPESIQRLVGTNLSGAGAIDFGTENDCDKMRAPKKIINNLYVETDMDSTDITKRLRMVLDLCNVDYAELEIVFESTRDEATDRQPVIMSATERIKSMGQDDRQKFNDWLLRSGMSKTTITSYMSSFGQCVKSVANYQLCETNLWDVANVEEASHIYDQLFGIPEFYEYNKQQHNRFSAAFRKFIEYRFGGRPSSVKTTQSIQFAVEKNPMRSMENESVFIRYKELLGKFFQKGFRMESSLDMKKLRRFYHDQYGTELSDEDGLVCQDISSITILHDGKAYLPELMLSQGKKDMLLQYIEDKFISGCDAIYYDALFSEFGEILQGERIYTPEMLKTYLSYINKGNYVLQCSYLAKDYTVQMNPEDEIREYLKEAAGPVEVEKIAAELSYIPEQKIRSALSIHDDFIRNTTGEYFYEDCVHFSNSELEWISQFIVDGIEEQDFVTGKELVEVVEAHFPDIKEMYQWITPVGMRNVIGYKLGDRFSFNGNIISKYGEDLSMAEVYTKYCHKYSRFTLDELNVLKQELGSTIYFDEIYANSLRISQNEFVSQDMAQFDIEATDEAIGRICAGQYMSLQEIRDFGTFPYAGYPWNEFLLEHFVANYSQKFMLLHIGYSANVCAGAIVKQTSSFKNFNYLLVDILANSNIVLDEDSALEYLRQQGYIVRRRYSDIGRIVTEAKVVRSKKG